MVAAAVLAQWEQQQPSPRDDDVDDNRGRARDNTPQRRGGARARRAPGGGGRKEEGAKVPTVRATTVEAEGGERGVTTQPGEESDLQTRRAPLHSSPIIANPLRSD